MPSGPRLVRGDRWPKKNVVELLTAEGAYLLEDQRGVNREQLRELHERLLGQLSVDAVVLLDRDRVVAGLLRRDGDEDHVMTLFVEGVRRDDQRGAPFRGAEISEGESRGRCRRVYSVS